MRNKSVAIFTIFSLLLILKCNYVFAQSGNISLVFPLCPQLCTCIYTTLNQLTIICENNSQNGITLANATQYPLQSTASIIIKNSSITSYPTNICAYASTLVSLDLSSNQINVGLSSSYLSCLTNLQYLYLYNNLIPSVDADSFQGNLNLKTIDLSYNMLITLPSPFITSALSKLLTLRLNNNRLTSLDSWFFYLPAINTIDLSNNLIATFTNSLGFSLLNATTLPQLLTNVLLYLIQY